MVLIRWTEESVSDLDKIDFNISKRIVAKIDWVAKNFESIVPEKLSHEMSHLYKLRVGDYRLLYEYKIDEIKVIVVDHRSRIYKNLR